MRLMTVTIWQLIMTTVTATTPTETAITKPTPGIKSMKQYSKRI